MNLSARRVSLLATLFALLSLVMAGGGYAYYRREARTIRLEQYEHLHTIAVLKTGQLVAWRNERLKDAELAASRPGMQELLARWLARPTDPSIRGAIRHDLELIRRIRGYQNALLADLDGRILLSLEPQGEANAAPMLPLLADLLREGRPRLGDFFRWGPNGRVLLDAGALVTDPSDHPLALLLLRSDPELALYPLIQSWPTRSESAETVLIRREGERILFLNRLRHRETFPLTLRFPLTRTDLPAVAAALGRTGEFSGLDYRGVPVMTDVQPVPGSPWILIAKVDEREIEEEIRYRGGVILGFVLFGILLSASILGLAFFLAQAKLYQDLFRATGWRGGSAGEVPAGRAQSARILAGAAGWAGLIMGILVLAGWAFHVPSLQGVLPGFTTMKANTAAGFVLAGLALVLETRNTFRAGARGCGATLALLGLLTLVEYAGGIDLGIDQLLFREAAGAIGTLAPNRMAPATALDFLLLGTALVLATWRRGVLPSQWLALPVGLTGLVSLVGYFAGPIHLSGIGYYMQLAIHTAVAFIILGLGVLLLNASEGFMRRALTDSIGGWLVRRLAPFLLGVPIAIGWLRVVGERRGWFEPTMAAALMIGTFAILLLGAVWWTARSLDHLDAIRREADTQVRERAQEIRATLYGLGDGVLTADDRGRVAQMNPVAERLTGWSEAEAHGRTLGEVFRIIHEKTREPAEISMEHLLSEGRAEVLPRHALLVARDGTERAVADSIAPVRDEQGRIFRIVLVFRDQTEERAAQRALLESEAKYRRLHDSMRDAYVMVDMEGRFLDCNQQYLELVGYSLEELRGLTFRDLTPERWREGQARIIREEVLTKGYSPLFEKEYRRKDGSIFPVELRSYLLKDEAGRDLGLWSLVRDITGRRQAEQLLRESESTMRSLVQASPETLVLMDTEGRIVAANEVAASRLGFRPAELIGACFEDLMSADVARIRMERVQEVVRTGRAVVFQDSRRGRHFRTHLEPVLDEAGKVIRIAVLGQDITAQIQVQQTLERDLRFQEMLSRVHEILAIALDEGQLCEGVCRAIVEEGHYELAWIGKIEEGTPLFEPVGVSGPAEAYAEGLQISADPLHPLGHGPTGTCFRENRPVSVPDWAADPLVEPWRERAERFGLRSSLSLPIPRGQQPWGVLTLYSTVLANFTAEYVPPLQNLTGTLGQTLDRLFQERLRRDAEKALRAKSDLLDETSRMAHVGGWEIDAVSLKGAWTDEVARIHDLDPSQGIDAEKGIGFYTEDSQPRIRKAVAEAIGQAKPYDLELEIISAKRVRKMVRTSGIPEQDETGRVVRVRGLFMDITEQKAAEARVQAAQAELRRLLDVAERSRRSLLSLAEDQRQSEEEIRRLNADLERRVETRTLELAAANKELEAFAYSVSHDLRAPLRHMDGFLHMLAQHLGEGLDEKGAHYLGVARGAAVKMGLLVDGLLSFSRLGRAELRMMNVDTGQIVASVIDEFMVECGGRSIEWQVGALPGLSGDPTLLRLVFQNLIGNALKFTRIRSDTVIEIQPLAGLDGEIGIRIRDNGVGFDPAYAHKLFGVFQRLHREDEFEGTGIGLANVQRIMARHGGRTWAEGHPGEGATFYLAFPTPEAAP